MPAKIVLGREKTIFVGLSLPFSKIANRFYSIRGLKIMILCVTYGPSSEAWVKSQLFSGCLTKGQIFKHFSL